MEHTQETNYQDVNARLRKMAFTAAAIEAELLLIRTIYPEWNIYLVEATLQAIQLKQELVPYGR
jgi:hypothetical protein